VPANEREEEEGGDTTTKGVEEGEKTQWSKGATSKGSSNVYGRMDNEEGGGDLYGVPGV